MKARNLFIVFTFLCTSHFAHAQNSLFTYQGKLIENGSPSSSTNDFRFRLYADPLGNNLVSTNIFADDIVTSNGAFVVRLDFGVAALDGSDRWLEVSVRPGSSSGAYTILAPLQQITSTPYAIRAANAGVAATVTGSILDAQLSSNIPRLNGSSTFTGTANFLNATGNFSGNGNGLTNLRAAELTGSISDAHLSGNVSLLGNSIESSEITDNTIMDPDVAPNAAIAGTKVNPNFGAQSVFTTGSIGIGTTNPLAMLTINSNIPDVYPAVPGITVGNPSGNSFVQLGSSATGSVAIAWLKNSFAEVRVDGGWPLVLNRYGNNVGIGTTTPSTQLDLESSMPSSGIDINNTAIDGDPRIALQLSGTSVFTLGVDDSDGDKFKIGTTAIDANTRLTIDSIGNVGIGTTTPLAMLTINSNIPDVYPAVPGITVGNPSGNSFVQLGSSATGSVAIAWLKDSFAEVRVDGGWPLVLNRYGNNVGIGTTTPGNILTVKQNSTTDPIADAWTTYSSRRWKTNIRPLQGALDKVERLRGVTYQLKDSGKKDIGLIAEEVGEVVPEVVTWEENGVDARSVDYARLTALLIEAVKEQQAQIKKQQAQIEELRARMDRKAPVLARTLRR